jgi:hypothetical protein
MIGKVEMLSPETGLNDVKTAARSKLPEAAFTAVCVTHDLLLGNDYATQPSPLLDLLSIDTP